MINWLVFSTFVLSMAMTILGLLVDLTYQVRVAPQIESLHKQQRNNLPGYLEDSKKFHQHTVFRPKVPARQDFAKLLTKIQRGDLQKPLIDEKVKKTIFSMGPKWLDQKHKIPQLETVELLFSEIEDYDHWSLPFDPDNNVASDLIVADQIFLAWTFHFKPVALRQALEKSRQLSQILLSTQDLNFKRAGMSLLEKENELLGFLKARYRNYQILWTPVSQQELKAFRYHLRQTARYLSPLAEPQLFTKVFLSESVPIGFCSIAKEKMQMLLWSQKFLEPRFPLEPDFSQTIKNIVGLQEQVKHRCQNWESPPTPEVTWFQHIPYYRRIYGTKMMFHAEKKRKIL